MEDTPNPAPSEELRRQKKGMLYDIYRKEADEHMAKHKYNKALRSFNLAIQLQPGEKRALIGRSRCYLHVGRTARAMQDVENALSIDASDTDAVFQKAEILYLTGNYQLASVYYRRAHRTDPDNPRFSEGVNRATEALHKFAGGAVAKNKLSAVGDLSFLLNSTRRSTTQMDFDDQHDKHGHTGTARDQHEVPSAGFRTRTHCPLVRISRKPRVPQLQPFRSEESKVGELGGLRGLGKEEEEEGEGGEGSALRQPDEDTMKKILGELYGDRQYLQRLQTNLPGGRAEQDLAELTDEGLQFLRDRSIFWDTLGPLPPPHPPRRGRGRERTFAGTGAEGVQDLPWKRRKKDQMALQRDVTQVDFQFRSHLTTRQRNRRGVEETREQSRRPPGVTEGADRGQWETGEGGGGGGGGGGGKRAGHVTLVGFDDLESDRRRQLTGFLNEELDDIDEAFREKRYEDCLHQARVVLHAVTSLPEDDVRRQAETVASLHSCIGNASIALERYDQALYHHQMALNIGEERKNNIIVARSLGHVGRMYIIQRKFSNALEVFARKAPMCSSLEDVTQTFQEIGNCFLVLGHYDYARDCGKKSLQAATQANLPFFQQQAWILIAIAEAKLQNLKEAYKAFTGAFQVARKKGDKDSQDAIRGAMDHVNRKINRLLRKKSLVNQRMLLRKAKTLTQDDLSPSKPPAARHVRHRKQPISKQKKGEVMADTGSREQSRDRPRYRTHVTAQGVGVVPASDDDDDDDYDDDFHSDAEDDFHYARDERPRPAMNDVTTSTERTAGGGKPSVNENDDEEPITFSLPCHLLSNDDDDDDDDDLLHTNRSQWEGEPPQTRDKRLVQTERSNRGNQATTRTEKRHGDRTSERLIQTERVERDEERRRFRREATVGSVNVDNNSYQQFARDASFNRASTLRAHQIYGTGRQSAVSRQSVWSRQSRHSLTTGHDSIVSRLTTKQERGGPTLDKPESQHGGSVLKRGESQHGGGVLKGRESQHGGSVLKERESQHGGSVLKGGESQHGGSVLKERESQQGGNMLKGRESHHGSDVLKGRESQHGGSAPKDRKSEDGRSQPDVLRNVEPLPPITARQTVTGRQQRREHRDLTGGLFQTTLSPRQEQTVSPEQKYIAASILDQRSPASQKQTVTLRNKKHEETKKVKKSEDEDDALYQAESVNTETERDQQGNDDVQYTVLKRNTGKKNRKKEGF
ncbi:uncharacterized protein LOC143276630 [Babylonia areolata]|uniref:uncharacterized protein LOC143276630 n=1 Tax=Babylonia areolata TaxID=304850 RepID=UPI003FD2E6BE